MDKDPKSLMRMLSAKGNPRADNLMAMVARLKQREGVHLSVQPTGDAGAPPISGFYPFNVVRFALHLTNKER